MWRKSAVAARGGEGGTEALAQGESVNQRGAKWRAGVLGKLREVMAQEGGWPVRRPGPAGPDSWRGFKWI
jgi:hypothetical protein